MQTISGKYKTLCDYGLNCMDVTDKYYKSSGAKLSHQDLSHPKNILGRVQN